MHICNVLEMYFFLSLVFIMIGLLDLDPSSLLQVVLHYWIIRSLGDKNTWMPEEVTTACQGHNLGENYGLDLIYPSSFQLESSTFEFIL